MDFGLYVVAQLVGATIASILVMPIAGDTGALFADGIGHPAKAEGASWLGAFLCELIITFALCHVVLHTATSKASEGKSYYGLAIGFTVLSGAISVGGVSGGAFNPAVSVLTLAVGEYSSVWLYWLGPLLGGALAGGLFRLTHQSEVKSKIAQGQGNDAKPASADFVIEFIGTFLLSFTVACAAAPANASSALASLSIGSMLMANVYAGGPTSGGHYNPAVTLAVYLRVTVFGGDDGLPRRKALLYVLTQLSAGVVAGPIARVCIGDIGYPAPREDVSLFVAWYVELLATFFLAFTVLQSATAPAASGNSFFGVAIGFVVTAMAVTVGPISGGALNPAVSMLAFDGSLNGGVDYPWRTTVAVYFTACPLGGILAALCYRVTNYAEFESTPGGAQELPSYESLQV